jgi:hypothetical protein
LPTHPARCLDGLFHPAASLLLLRHPVAQTLASGTGISTSCPSTTPFGLALGPDLPWADDPSPGTLGLSADKILTCLFATYTGILTSMRSTKLLNSASPPIERSPTQAHSRAQAKASVASLAPLHFPRSVTRPVSYYALFKWWLLLSQHPGCLCTATSFPT